MLSLIPAKYYYDDATQDQWQQKKKLKQDASRDKRAKLDPENSSSADSYNNGGASAKDVMENRAKTAKKVVLPGAVDHSKAQEKAEKKAEREQALISEEGPVMEFDDDGNALGEEPVAAPKQKQTKKELDPEEKKAREQRRAELKAKLASKISLLREKRKAPGTKNGRPVKSREEMLAERKRKEEYRKQLKRKREQEESEDDKSDNEDEDDEDNEEANGNDDAVLFGNIVFKDGSRVTSDLTKLRNGVDSKKKKGPSNNDIKGHLAKLEAKKRKLETMTPEQRAKQQEKDQWLGLMAQAEGVKVKNDEKLLKKALKRKEKQKLKSEVEWKERKQVVKDTIAARLKRREANLKLRRENKGKKSKNIPRLKKFSGVVKKGGKNKDGKKRAGFEGSAKSKGKLK